MRLKTKVLANYGALEPPRYANPGDAGFDLRAAIPADQDITLYPGQQRVVPTGLAFAVEPGYELQIRPRSGMAANHGVTVLNAPGTIDAGYRGEVKVLMVNHGDAPVKISRGMRVAQAVLAPVFEADFVLVNELDASERGEGGFGSSGAQ